MKKAIIAVLCVALLVVVFSCKHNSSPFEETYTGTDTLGKEYTLIINDNDYDLLIDGTSVSTGSASKNGAVWTLTPNSGGADFTITVEGTRITKIDGVITPDDGSAPITPGQIVQPEKVSGAWTWALSDDTSTNQWKNTEGRGQSIFTPGGVSKFTNSIVETLTEAWIDRNGNSVTTAQRPYIYPAGTVKDNEGNVIDAEVFNFTGNTKVISDNHAHDNGARYPLLGWEAVPNAETLELLKTAYSYSFWVRLNSATASKWSFLSAVITDFEPEEGFEYKHWFGNQIGASGGGGANNITDNLKLGVWYKITVVLNKDSPKFNMAQDKWLFDYPASPDPRKDFNQAAAEKIQWQIPLQHNGGVQGNTGTIYYIKTGSYDFNLDFYGLELNME